MINNLELINVEVLMKKCFSLAFNVVTQPKSENLSPIERITKMNPRQDRSLCHRGFQNSNSFVILGYAFPHADVVDFFDFVWSIPSTKN
jgi:hypothetical protein